MSIAEPEDSPSPSPPSSGNGGAPPGEDAPATGQDHSALRTAERARDVAEASRDRFSFLAEVSRCLADSLDYEATLVTVAGMSLPYLDAWCIVDVLDEQGEVRRIAVVHPDPAKQETARRLHTQYPPRAGDLIGAPRVIRTGRPEMVFDVPDEALVSLAHDPAHLALLRSLGIRSYVIVPMVARGRVLGAMTFVTAETGRRFGEIDVVMAEDLARRAAMAVDNARLHREALEARGSADQAREAADQALVEAQHALQEASAAEAGLREARDAAEEALRARNEFVSTITHEVQTPLNAIIGYLQLLEMDVSGSLAEAQRAYVLRGQESARHLLRLVGDVLDFSRSESARLEVSREELSARDTALGALALVRPQAAARHLALVDDLRAAAGLRYLGDEYRVRQILVNLLSNAVKFTPAGGRVELACRAVDDAPGDGRWVEFTVRDTGHGVKAQDAERIFEPFVQGEAGLTRPHGGTGLGLPISRRLARLMGGDVAIGAADRGASFTLRLPAGTHVAPPPGDEGDAVESGAPAADRRRGLVAAGEALLRELGPTVHAFVRRARSDPALGLTEGLSDVDVADHLATLVTDVANSLVVMGGASDEPGDLLADGKRIQRVIGELHGAQRHRMGWTEAQLEREVDVVRTVCGETLDRALAGDEGALSSARSALERLLDERTRACLAGFRGSVGQAG